MKKLKPKHWYLIIGSVILISTIFAYSRKKVDDNKIPLQIKGSTVKVEIADSPKEQAMGLMFRKKLKEDEGMLFTFDNETKRSFWMKNTLIPLDIIWLNSDKEVVHIEHSAPPCKESPCPSYSSNFPAQYVLELKGGWSIKHGLELGDTVSF